MEVLPVVKGEEDLVAKATVKPSPLLDYESYESAIYRTSLGICDLYLGSTRGLGIS